MSRWILVDDTDAEIAYTGQWFGDDETSQSLGNFGPPYLNTLHGTISNASFSYAFSGTTFMIVGSNLNTNSTGVTWQCHIDGVLMTSILPTTPENNLLLCEPSGNQLDLTDGPHVITVNVTASDVRVFWFDYIQYIPSASVPLDHVALSIDAGYPQFQYGTGWGISQVPAGDGNLTTGNITAVTASTFGFDFKGVSVTWLGFYSDKLPLAATTATYAIDGQAPITFNLNGSPSQSTGYQTHQIFFQAAQLPAGPHKLDVVYQGNSATTPLALSNLIIQNDASTSPASSSFSGTSTISYASVVSSSSTVSGSSSSSTSAAASLLNGGHRSNKTRVVIGGVTGGGIAIVCLAILGYFFLHRRNKYNSKNRRISSSTISNINLHPSIPLSRISAEASNLVVSPFTLHPVSANPSNSTDVSHNSDAEQSSSPLIAVAAQTRISDKANQGSTSLLRLAIEDEDHQQEIQVEPPRNDHDVQIIMRDADGEIRFHENGGMVELLPPSYTAA